MPFRGDAANEVRERLLHLTYLVERVRQLERQARELMTRGTEEIQLYIEETKKAGIEFDPANLPAAAKRSPEEIKNLDAWTTEAQIFTEAFYYFSGRIRSLLRHKSEPIPRLHSFECEGVRNVRNHLIEHPEGGNSLVLIRSFGWVGDNGPVVKAVRYSHQEKTFPDAGLYRNAEVFKANLERLLQQDPTSP
ncbi:MAG TPA: hypothetical protein VFG14_05300 [Chthoniobacteraceae bacterium]|nr:hypothetical protein [Chthoniobacteraceae bacterium]